MQTNWKLIALASTIIIGGAACGGDSADDPTGDDSEPLTGDPKSVNLGFNGPADQFGYVDDFFAASVHPGPRLCHTYVAWNVGEEQPSMGNANSPDGTRPYLEYWLHQAQGHCDEALVSFKALWTGDPPKESQYARAFTAFVTTDWAKRTGFTGAISFTPWNEPNNGGSAGSGLGNPIPADTAAAYYLTAERICRSHGCKVAAGDFASNGDMWNAFEWNCANDNVDPQSLCKVKSSANTDGRGASYLDRYKNFIANHADEYGLGKSFRPAYFAFHGWHDINGYLDKADHCKTYGDCATRRIVKSLSGSWSGAELWDTEVGVDQDRAPISDPEQACGAAFLLRMTAISKRITRIYYTRLHRGTGELERNHKKRAAFDVLANRDARMPSHCK